MSTNLPMLLSRRILIGSLLLLLGLLALCTVPLLGLYNVSSKVQVAVKEYTELRLIQTAALHLALAENLMISGESDVAGVRSNLQRAEEVLREYVGFQTEASEGSENHENREQILGNRSLETVSSILNFYSGPAPALNAEMSRAHMRDLGNVLSDLNRLAVDADHLVAATQHHATRIVRNTIIALAALGSIVVIVGTLIAVSQYRRVMRPLGALRHGVRTLASGSLSTRVPEIGDLEFMELAADFNRMAHELDALYRGLEEKVAAKSRELVQSERLASVGFLAAGVAHEINNPLHIISGYAELSLRRLRRSFDPESAEDAAQTLQIIRDEAFRCKGITEKLLSLSAPADEAREPLSLSHLVDDVFGMLRHTKWYRDRRFQMEDSAGKDLTVLANENEIKQVLLNLVVNAVEATEPGGGEIRVELTRQNGSALMAVCDNGQGMTPDVCQRVFEPFFSVKRATGGRGTGLGLSISHAIIAGHSGRLSAFSNGPGQGSRFTIELPIHQGGRTP